MVLYQKLVGLQM